LRNSITLWWWVRTSSLAPGLQVGIRKNQPDLQGHAWVECDGHLFDEALDGATQRSLLDWRSPD